MKTLTAVFMIFLSGCATTGKLKSKLDIYIGHPSIEVVQKFGAPQKTMQIAENTVYSYHIETNTTISEAGYGLSARTHYCDLTFLVDQSSLVKSWTAHGDSCKAN